MELDLPKLKAALKGSDVLAQNDAVADAIRMGAKAVPVLLSLWKEPGIARGQVMYALGQIGDARAESVFEQGVRDGDEKVRAYAARGLARIGNAGAMDALLRTLNDGADELHLDITPSVGALAAFGLDAVPPLLDRLLSDDQMTRLHAERALQLVVASLQASTDGNAGSALWQQNGGYSWDGGEPGRRASVALWRTWLSNQRK